MWETSGKRETYYYKRHKRERTETQQRYGSTETTQNGGYVGNTNMTNNVFHNINEVKNTIPVPIPYSQSIIQPLDSYNLKPYPSIPSTASSLPAQTKPQENINILPKKDEQEINRKNSPPKSQIQENPTPTSNISNARNYSSLQELLRRIIALEFSAKCTQRSMAVVQTICDTLCQDPIAVVKVMEVLDECFADAVKKKQQQQLLNYWYILDAIMKLFRDRPSMLNAVVVALPHLLLQYVPWKKSNLGEESWMQREKDENQYEHLFRTWSKTVPEILLEEIWEMWEKGPK